MLIVAVGGMDSHAEYRTLHRKAVWNFIAKTRTPFAERRPDPSDCAIVHLEA
jgi:hypothetical protein